jgi:hypothetical protein
MPDTGSNASANAARATRAKGEGVDLVLLASKFTPDGAVSESWQDL